MPKKRQISRTDRLFYKLRREEMWMKQGKKCKYCGTKITKQEATFDHVDPISKRGYHSFENCVVACQDCNGKKSDQTDWEPEVAEVSEWQKMIDDWKARVDERLKRFEFSFDPDTKGGYNKWVRYWSKRGKWD